MSAPAFIRRLLLASGLALLLGWAGASLGHDNHGEGANTAPATQRMGTAPHAGLGLGAAFAPDGTLWITGLDASGQLFVQTQAKGSHGWAPRRPLDTAGDSVSADGENRPKIAFGPASTAMGKVVVITYTHPLSKPYTGEIRLLRSTDGGQSFAAPITLHQDRQVITHRFESIAFDGAGHLHAIWIDKRDQVAAPKNAPYRGAAVYRNESADGGATFGPDIKVADHSCECCRIALAPTADGQVAALWRHVFAPNLRDHAFAVLGVNTGQPVRASFDNWAFDACPHHGPGLAAASDGGFHAVWFGYREGVPAVRYARLDRHGAPWGAAQALPDNAAEHADVAAHGHEVAIVWRSYDGTATRLRAWLSNDDGAHFTLRDLARSTDENDHPRLAYGPDALRVVWRTEKEIHVFPLAP